MVSSKCLQEIITLCFRKKVETDIKKYTDHIRGLPCKDTWFSFVPAGTDIFVGISEGNLRRPSQRSAEIEMALIEGPEVLAYVATSVSDVQVASEAKEHLCGFQKSTFAGAKLLPTQLDTGTGKTC